MDGEKKKEPVSIIEIIYLVLTVLVLVFGFIFFFEAFHFQIVNLVVTISFWVCFIAPLAATGLYVLFYSLGLDTGYATADKQESNLIWLAIIFILSSAAMIWYAYPGRLNIGSQWSIRWYISLFTGIGILLVILFIPEKWEQKYRKLFSVVSFGAITMVFLFGAFLSANIVLDTSELVITTHTVVRAERPNADANRFFVTVADSAGNQRRMRTSADVFWHSRDNTDGVIYLGSRAGAFNITYYRLAVPGA